VEVALLADGRVAVRDGKNPERDPQFYSAAEWQDFIAGVKNGEFDIR
jgi:ABC-type amino acid transport substrate-binding protein